MLRAHCPLLAAATHWISSMQKVWADKQVSRKVVFCKGTSSRTVLKPTWQIRLPKGIHSPSVFDIFSCLCSGRTRQYLSSGSEITNGSWESTSRGRNTNDRRTPDIILSKLRPVATQKRLAHPSNEELSVSEAVEQLTTQKAPAGSQNCTSYSEQPFPLPCVFWGKVDPTPSDLEEGAHLAWTHRPPHPTSFSFLAHITCKVPFAFPLVSESSQ